MWADGSERDASRPRETAHPWRSQVQISPGHEKPWK
jgi:hypothetical protein